MCGRFVSTAGPDAIAAYFGAVIPTVVATESLGANYNVAPTQDIYALVSTKSGDARLESFHWGLIPSWAKDRKIASKMINARAETLAEKPAFKRLLRTSRCIIPMDGFYEWRPGDPSGPRNAKGQPLKQPMYIHRADAEPLAVAGLWSTWKDPDDAQGRHLHSATIITTAANSAIRPVHDRMPAILRPEHWRVWLDTSHDDPADLREMLDGGSVDPLRLEAVSTAVNSVRNNAPDLIAPLSR